MTNNTGLTLGDVMGVLSHRWKLAVLVFLAMVLGVAAYTYSLSNSYQAKSTVSLEPRPGSGASAADVSQLGQKYIAYVTAPTEIRPLAAQLGVPAQTLQDGVDAEIATGSINLTIQVELPSGAKAARASNQLASDVDALAVDDKLLSARTVAPAVVPTSAAKPRRKLILGGGVLIALLVAAGVAFAVERGRPRIRSAMEVAYITGHGVIGRLPSSRSVRGGVTAALADPLVGGAIRSLRTVLDHEARDAAVRSLAITSSIPGEGKSTVAACLASAIARLDARVLLIDADLRHPSVGDLFHLPPKPGLVDVLDGRIALRDAARHVPDVPGLWVVPTVGMEDPGDLLARQFGNTLRAATAEFDVVIVDTPPLLAADDAGTIATVSDAVLLVVAAGVETRRLGEASRTLDSIQVRVMGALLNRADVPTYGESYRASNTTSAPRNSTVASLRRARGFEMPPSKTAD